jgi:hypothetical protein
MKKIFTLAFAFLSANASALDPNHFTITRITAPYFIVDGNSPATITKAYVGFEVKNNSNSATPYSNLKFTITSIGTSVSGQNYSVVAPASGIINIGTLAPGQSKVCYYYVSYPASTSPQGTFNVQLSDNTATSKTQSFIISNRSSISANAGGTATQSFTNEDLIGGLVIDDVTYIVGNVQNNDESDFQVAVSSQFDPTKITLLGTQVIASSVPGIPNGTTDSLYFRTGNGSNGASVTIRWIFRITGFNFTNYLLPCAGATSGATNYKYALNTSLGAGSPITVSASANPLTITKTSDKTLYGISSASLFTITINNPGAYGVTIDKITDELPLGFTFQTIDASSQVTSANSTSSPAMGAMGTITFEGGVTSGSNTSYYVPAGGNIVLKYTATTSLLQGFNLLTTARNYIGTTQVGSAQNTISVSGTLPVTLVSFNGSWLGNCIKLDWTTSNEINSRKIIVERSNDIGSFIQIGELEAARSSLSVKSYSFIDSVPAAGNNLYRLKLVDIDGKYEYSRIISFSKQNSFSLLRCYPNPLQEDLHLQLSSDKKQDIQFRVTDVSGKIILVQKKVCEKGINTIVLDQLSFLQPGIYFLHITNSTGDHIQQKLLKIKE